MPTGTLQKWEVSFRGLPIGSSDTEIIEDCETFMNATTARCFTPDITVQLKNAPDLYELMKRLFRRITAKMLPNHIWSKHCNGIRRALRSRWFK